MLFIHKIVHKFSFVNEMATATIFYFFASILKV